MEEWRSSAVKPETRPQDAEKEMKTKIISQMIYIRKVMFPDVSVQASTDCDLFKLPRRVLF